MAIRFSQVTIATDKASESFLVEGVPKKYEDLEGCRTFDGFLENVDEGTKVSVRVKSYLYGDGEAVEAAPEEVAYMMIRVAMRPNFLKTRCKKDGESGFTFEHSKHEMLDYPFLEP